MIRHKRLDQQSDIDESTSSNFQLFSTYSSSRKQKEPIINHCSNQNNDQAVPDTCFSASTNEFSDYNIHKQKNLFNIDINMTSLYVPEENNIYYSSLIKIPKTLMYL